MLRAVAICLAGLALLASEARATFPGGNGQIAFQANSGSSGNIDIWAARADGTGLTRLTTAPNQETDATYSADGERLAYTRFAEDFTSAGIWTMNADGTGQAAVPLSGNQNVYPAWAPDGTRLAYVSVRQAEGATVHDLKVASATGGGEQTVVSGPQIDQPEWSPGGAFIVFHGQTAAGTGVHVVSSDGGGDTLVGGPADQWPSWSPDGRRIMFTRLSAAGSRTASVDLSGGDLQYVGTGTDHAYGRYSPDGRKVLVFRNGDGNGEWVMNLDGSDAVKIGTFFGASRSWQPLHRDPVIFIHGFAGSILACGDDELWPDIPEPELSQLHLAADGVTNAGDTPCSAAAAPTGELVLTAGGDVYGSAAAFLTGLVGADRAFFYPWDWRKGPEHAIDGLDAMIERARCGFTPPAGQSCPVPEHEKVAIMAHSYGGLLTRLYVDDPQRAAKVDRAVTLGTPYLGAPKALLPVLAGIESPQFSALDVLLADDEFRAFARNLQGNYFLFPSTAYGPWLTDTAGGRTPLEMVELAGGNRALLQHALDMHASTLDGFETNGVDYQAIVGTGVPTITGIRVDGAGTRTLTISATYGNGDGTVPMRSAQQGATGSPLGEDVPIKYVCNVSHVPLPGHPDATSRIRDFLDAGDVIVGDGPPCPAEGYEIEIVVQAPHARALRSFDPAAYTALEQAEIRGDVQLLDFGARKLVITDDDRPVSFPFSAGAFTVRVTRLLDEARGETKTYGPLSGTAVISAGTSVTVTQEPVPGGGPVEPPATAQKPPVLSRLRVRPRRLHPRRRGGSIAGRRAASVARRRGARVSYRLSRAAQVTFRVQRRRGGSWKAMRGRFRHAGSRGANAFRFTGRLRRRALRPGRHRLIARPAGGAAVRTGFRVRRRATGG